MKMSQNSKLTNSSIKAQIQKTLWRYWRWKNVYMAR